MEQVAGQHADLARGVSTWVQAGAAALIDLASASLTKGSGGLISGVALLPRCQASQPDEYIV